MNDWRYIMFHHSATRDSGTVSWGAIREYHTSVRGWDDIGYHFGVELVHSPAGPWTYEILKGRSLFLPGAHCLGDGMNHLAIGVCLVGNYQEEIPVLAMLHRVRFLCNDLRRLFPSIENFTFHRDHAGTNCPGQRITRELIQEHVWRRP